MTDPISWEDYFMSKALLASKRSKDPHTQVGACIVKNQVILGMGYNGFPRGLDCELPWKKDDPNELNNKHFYVCHAELNAISNSHGDIKCSQIYTTLFPCPPCAQLIIQSGISEVIYMNDKSHKIEYQASRRLLNLAKVKLTQFNKTNTKVTIDLGTGEAFIERY
uniref:CMP/dCMP-type deaminase domain-containing protein n=1 Tax=Rhabditophanes sp. KR3021 TaxID=114890 RepID=A0AC35UIE2_9BILA